MRRLTVPMALGLSLLLISCATTPQNEEISLPTASSFGNPNYDPNTQRFVVIPSGQIPLNFLMDLRNRLETLHSERILISTEMGLREEWYMPDQEQYNSTIIAHDGHEIFRTFQRPNSYCVIITDRDINYPESGLRYIFSAAYPFGVSVVSIARLNPRSYGIGPDLLDDARAYELLMERTIKIVNKELGKGYYKHAVSGDIGSVMYGPLMSVEDVDKMGTRY